MVEPSQDRVWRSKRWAFRAAAVLLGFLPWLVLETSLRLYGWPAQQEPLDIAIGFEATQPLWTPSADGEWLEISPARRFYFQYDKIPAQKLPSEKRVFVLGGSTVQGNPYTIETAFSTWARIALQTTNSDVDWTIANCGGMSYASYRLVPIVDEVLNYEPDLIVLCTGHNEFLEHREFRDYLRVPRWQRQLGAWARQSALISASRSLLDDRSPLVSESLPAEVDALLDHLGGASHYSRDWDWQAAVEQQYESSLRTIARKCRERGVDVIVVIPVSDLRDTPPFKSQTLFDVVAAEEFEAAVASPQWLRLTPTERLARLSPWREAAPDYAAIHYHEAIALDELGDWKRAEEAYRRARDYDVCPLRCTSPLEAELRLVASENQWPTIDMPALLSHSCRGEITDRTVLIDHVHPNIESHQLIGVELARAIATELLVECEFDSEKIQASFDAWLSTLPVAYFEHGAERLRLLEKWARGNVERGKPPIEFVSSEE